MVAIYPEEIRGVNGRPENFDLVFVMPATKRKRDYPVEVVRAMAIAYIIKNFSVV